MQWIDKTQPQTLQSAVLLSYLNAAIGLLYLLLLGASLTLVLPLLAVTAYGIANEWRWAYWGGVVLAGLYLLGEVAFLLVGHVTLFTLLFAGVLFGLLVHPMSRDYQKVWFH